MRRAIAAMCIAASFACNRGERYTYTQRTAEGRTEPVRIDKETGRAEVLTQRAGGTPRWVVVEEASGSTTGAVPQIREPEAKPFSEADTAKIFRECRFVPRAEFSDDRGLECTLTNASQWDLLSIDLFISLNGFEKKYVMDSWSAYPGYTPKKPLPLAPGETATWTVLFSEEGQSYRFIRMMGYPHNR